MKVASKNEPDNVVDDLNPAEYRKTGEEAHGASNKAEGGFSCHLSKCQQTVLENAFGYEFE